MMSDTYRKYDQNMDFGAVSYNFLINKSSSDSHNVTSFCPNTSSEDSQMSMRQEIIADITAWHALTLQLNPKKSRGQ